MYLLPGMYFVLMFKLLHMILVCQYEDTWLNTLSFSCRIIDVFEDIVNAILQDVGFNLDIPLLVEEEDVALRVEKVRLQWVFDTTIIINNHSYL